MIDIRREADDLIAGFDRDGDGAVSVQLETHDERWVHDPVSNSYRRIETSIERLARVADRFGDGDGQATRAELLDALRRYDAGDGGAVAGDGILAGREALNYLEDLGPQARITAVVGPTLPPPPGAGPGRPGGDDPNGPGGTGSSTGTGSGGRPDASSPPTSAPPRPDDDGGGTRPDGRHGRR